MNAKSLLGAMPTLGGLNVGSDNNLNLIRALAAIAVALSHSFLLVTSDPDSRPLISATGFSIGYHAVNIFFVASGFLVFQSWSRRSSLTAFAVARGIRILPGLAVCAFLVAFVGGPLLSTLPFADYLTSEQPYKYFLLTATLVSPVAELPGVFAGNPDAYTINGSLWTLRYEIICYVALALAGSFGLFSRPRLFLGLAVVGGIALVILSSLPIAHDNTISFGHMVRFGFCFGLGIVAFQYREFIPLHWSGVLVLVLLAVATREQSIYPAILYLTTAYVSFWFAYVPAGKIRAFNRTGDFSYGIYIYAFPLQQALIYTFPNLMPVEMFAATLVLTLPVAIASWYLIEKPALGFKNGMIGWFDSRAARWSRA